MDELADTKAQALPQPQPPKQELIPQLYHLGHVGTVLVHTHINLQINNFIRLSIILPSSSIDKKTEFFPNYLSQTFG